MRVLTGGKGNTRGGANRGIDVKVGELDSLGSESVDVLGFDGAAEAGKIRVAHVIDENDDNIGSVSGMGSLGSDP